MLFDIAIPASITTPISDITLSVVLVSHGITLANTSFPITGGELTSKETTTWGWTVGLGLEYMIAQNWSAKIEYMHYGFDSLNAPIGSLALLQPVALGVRIDTVKVGINYRWGGPIVARY